MPVSFRLLWRLLLAIMLAAAALLVMYRVADVDILSVPSDDHDGLALPAYLALGDWVPARELTWERASTGWEAIGSPSLPVSEKSLAGGPISIAGTVYDDGFSTYPFSEIELALDGQFALFEAHVGVDDSSGREAGVVFSVVLDEVSVYVSSPMARGDPPQAVSVPLSGASSLRLVTARGPGSSAGGYANWADLKLFRPMLALGSINQPAPVAPSADGAGSSPEQSPAVAAERQMLATLAQDEASYLAARGAPEEAAVVGAIDAARRRYLLMSSELGLIFHSEGDDPNSFSLIDRRQLAVLVDRASIAISIDGMPEARLADSALEDDQTSFQDVIQTGLGAGKALSLPFQSPDGDLFVVRFFLFPGSRHLLLDADVPHAAPGQRIEYAFLRHDAGGLPLGAGARALADFSRPRHVAVRADGLPRTLVVDFGKPAILWGGEMTGAAVLAAIDETARVPRLELNLPPESIRASAAFIVSQGTHGTRSPRVLLDFPSSPDLREATSTYKRLMRLLYPPAPLPDWVRFQWLSWYPFEMDISSARIKAQVDLLAKHFVDLGPWHIIVDAGWYVAEGRPGSDLRAVDRQKFPEGLRRFVRDVHAKGVKVLIYINTPLITSHQKRGDWTALRDTVEEHEDWLIPIGSRRDPTTFVYDYTSSGLRAYMDALMADIFQRYDADGLKIDGLGGAEGVSVARSRRDAYGAVGALVDQSTEIVRFTARAANRLKANLYFEGGWHNPGFAQAYAHTFRYGDDAPDFSAPYPTDGLVEHIDYATYMKTILGQRPNMGALTDDDPGAAINLDWLRAGIALDALVELSFDLSKLDGQEVAEYRALLNHHQPFTGQTRVDRVLEPSVFLTRRDDVAYLGLLNRSPAERAFVVPLGEFGLNEQTTYWFFDVADKAARSAQGSFSASLAPRTFRLFVVAAGPSVVWTSSKYAPSTSNGSLSVGLTGPEHVAGFATCVLPRPPRLVLFDGVPLSQGKNVAGVSYQGQGNVVTVTYPHDTAHRLQIEF